MSMYFVDLLSNRPMVKIPMATQPKPARNPAVSPLTVSVSGAVRNMASVRAITNDHKKAKPKILPVFPCFNCSSLSLFSSFHAFPNKKGEYHNPPKTKLEMEATITAYQLICERSILLLLITG